MRLWIAELRCGGPTLQAVEELKMNPYSSLCDDFGVYIYLNTKMELPSGRETVLHFFDTLQKQYPQMTDFECRESGEYVLEEDRDQGSYRWVPASYQLNM